ncbi:hypothetical protein [Ramlibacter tataouinensis]|uniref:Uncharacterized protein n=1 Tax=Ramlibacter tataouinensis (strain ATCC BAA-407 / DSM 14655 / LMG 21543 / TTB310) TaxID=365046 RepID=F5Y4F3_RAMTT|nr:hypothetical protein [Ramlibacter tataouinensis]AEG93800.1 Hypothetical protein Rta_26985 [Ramlibacter tataouinensis TTB310]
MELARFHRAIHVIHSDISNTEIETKLTRLISSLDQVAASPGNQDYAKVFREQLDDLRSSLNSSSLNDPEDADVAQVIEDLSLEGHVGTGFARRILKAITQNQLAPQAASAELTKLRDEVFGKLRLISSVDSAFTTLQVDYARLDGGEGEMRIAVPFASETHTLEELAKEAREWDKICAAISEAFDPERTPVTVRTVSTGSLLLYLAGTPAFIWGVSKCLKGVNSILGEVIKMRKLYGELVKSNVPREALAPIEQHNAGKAKFDLDALATTIIEEHYKGNDEGRKNELRNSLSMALQRLARKLADGADVRLRLTAPKKPKIAEGVEPTPEQVAQIEAADKVAALEADVRLARVQLEYEGDNQDLIAALPAPQTE